MRTTIELDGPWRFQPDFYEEGDREGFERRDWDDSKWLECQVPCDFSTALSELAFYEGGGWYRRLLDVPQALRDQHNVLRFEGVNHRCRVWVNGRPAGENQDAYLPFEIAVDDLLDYGASNSIVVFADSTCYPEDVPGMQRGWHTFGGLVRSVSLVSTSRLHISDVATDARSDGALRVRVNVSNGADVSASTSVDVSLVALSLPLGEGEGEVRGPKDSLALEPGEHSEINLSATIPDIDPWSPESPNLYDLTVSLTREGDVVDARTITIGFRTIETRDGQLLLNGSPIYLTGFNRHEDSPRTTMAPDPELARQDLESMKAAGANFVRLCHYPHDSGELDLCDELGLLAMDEVPLYWWGGKWDEENHEPKLAASRRQLETMIARDINHPSVIFWSVSNETSERAPGVVEGNRELVKLAQELDASRPAVHVSNHWTEVKEFDDDDVICVNGYPAWGRMHKGGNGTFTLEDATRWWADELEKLHEAFPGKPILVAEFGHPALLGVGAGALGEPSQSAALAAEFEAMHAPYICGATVWCYADHPWPGGFSFMKNMTVSPYGVVTRDREKKQGYSAISALFNAKQSGA